MKVGELEAAHLVVKELINSPAFQYFGPLFRSLLIGFANKCEGIIDGANNGEGIREG